MTTSMNLENVDELVYWFKLHFPEYVKEMEETQHGTDGRSNLYHTEGSIWTHTMMVLIQADNFDMPKAVKIAALLHDLGKPNSAVLVDKDNQETIKRFIGHEGVSFYKAVRPLNMLKDLKLINEQEMNDILTIISHHGTLFNHVDLDNLVIKDKYSKLRNKWKHNTKLFKKLVKMSKADSLGRFSYSTNGNRNNRSNIGKYFESKIFSEEYMDELQAESVREMVSSVGSTYTSKITVLVGVPNVGKSTWVKQNCRNQEVISRDSLLVEYAFKHFKGEDLTYNEAWNRLSKTDQDNIQANLEAKIQNAISTNQDIVIDMTMLSVSSRKRILNRIPKSYQKEAVVFVTDFETIMERNSNRVGKVLSTELILNMMKSFMVPLQDEFSVVRYFHNPAN